MNAFSRWNWNFPSEAARISMKVLSVVSSAGENALSTLLPKRWARRPGWGFWTSLPWFAPWEHWANELQAPSAWTFCALKRLLFKEGVGERKKLLAQTAFFKGGEQPSPSDEEGSQGATCLLSWVSPEPEGRKESSCQVSLRWPTDGLSSTTMEKLAHLSTLQPPHLRRGC